MSDDVSGLYNDARRVLKQIQVARGQDELCEFLMSMLQEYGGWQFIYAEDEDDDDFHQPITEH